MKFISKPKASTVINWRYRVNDQDFAASEPPAPAHALNWRYKLEGVTYEPTPVANLSSDRVIQAINWRYQIQPADLN